jgi:hypothetical protein
MDSVTWVSISGALNAASHTDKRATAKKPKTPKKHKTENQEQLLPRSTRQQSGMLGRREIVSSCRICIYFDTAPISLDATCCTTNRKRGRQKKWCRALGKNRQPLRIDFWSTFSLVHKNTNIHPCLIAKRLAFASR